MKYSFLILLFLCSLSHAEIYLCGTESNYYSDKECGIGEAQTLVELKPVNSLTPPLKTEEFKNGYELFLNSKRIGHEPGWTITQAVEHYRWYLGKNETTAKSIAYYNSVKILLD